MVVVHNSICDLFQKIVIITFKELLPRSILYIRYNFFILMEASFMIRIEQEFFFPLSICIFL